MRLSTGSLVGLLCAANLVVGWSIGYHSFAQYLTCWVLTALPVITAGKIVVHQWPSVEATGSAIRIAIIALAMVVGIGLLLGGLRLLTIERFLAVESIFCAASFTMIGRQPPSSCGERAGHAPSLALALVAGLEGGFVRFSVAFAAAPAPRALFDS